VTCYSPLRAFRAREGRIVFNRKSSVTGSPIEVSCGQCLGCRLNRSRQWAIRCMHEASLYDDNCFVTLTYSPANLPDGNTLVVKHFQDFMKRLRHHFAPQTIRFYACGEYGEINERPHYHACLFNINFSDRVPFKEGSSGELQYTSETLDKLWPMGFSTIGSLTIRSAAYTARYIMDKLTGEAAIKYQPHVDLSTGEVYGERVPPFNLMSRRPGVGFGWLAKFKTDAFPCDYVVVDGQKVAVPRYYDALYEKGGGDVEKLKKARKRRMLANADDATPERLKVREIVQRAKLRNLSREI